MWIRSQNKKVLMDAKMFDIFPNSRNSNIDIRCATTSIDGNDCSGIWYLGSYKTEERAMEILNDIQSFICGSIDNQNNPPEHDIAYWNSVFAVYQMPKE